MRMAAWQRRSSRIARLPPTSLLDLEVMESMTQELLALPDEENREETTSQTTLMDQISSFLERAEEDFQQLVGIPFVASSFFNQRSSFVVPRSPFTVGRLAAMVQQNDVMELVTEKWVENAEVPKQLRASGLRLLLACMTICGFQYPLTEEGFVTQLRHWAFEMTHPDRLDAEGAAAEEAIRTCSAGLLAIAVTNTAHCEEAVRSGLITPLIDSLYQSIEALDSDIEIKLPSGRQQATQGALLGNPHPVHRTLQEVTDSLPSTPGDDAPDSLQRGGSQGAMETPASMEESQDGSELAPEDQLQTPRRLGRPPEKDESAPAAGSQTIAAVIQAEQLDEAAVAEVSNAAREQPVFPRQLARGAVEAEGVVTSIGEEVSGRRLQYLVQCAVSLGAYLEFLPPLIGAGGVELVLRLLDGWRSDRRRLHDGLQWLASLLAHRKIADAVVDDGGLDLLLNLPRPIGIQTAMALVFVGLALIPSALARVSALPNPTVLRFVEAAIEPLGGSEDPARKSAAVFLFNALSQPVILAAFDELEGLRRVLTALSNSMLLLRNHSGGRQEKQICYPLCQALSLYFRASFVQHVGGLCGELPTGEAVQVDSGTLDARLATLASNPSVAEAFLRSPWAPAQVFKANGGLALMLDIIQASPGEKYFTEMALSALETLGVVTLLPACRQTVLCCENSGKQSPVSTLLAAASGTSFIGDEEVKLAALRVIVNCVAAPKAAAESVMRQPDVQANRVANPIASVADASARRSFAAARKQIRNANGLRTMLGLLQSRPSANLANPRSLLKIRTLAAQALLGLAQDPDICHTLSKLQVGKRLAELLHESAGASSGSPQDAGSWSGTFATTAIELISLTTPGMGKAESVAAMDAAAPALHKMERAAIAAASHVTYYPEELLGLIRDHLAAAGLRRTATLLEQEAGLREEGNDRQSEQSRLGSRPASSGAVRKRISFAPSLRESLVTPLRPPPAEAHGTTRAKALPKTLSCSNLECVSETRRRNSNDGELVAAAGWHTPQPAAASHSGTATPAQWSNGMEPHSATGSRSVRLKLSGKKRWPSEQLPLQLHPHLRAKSNLSPLQPVNLVRQQTLSRDIAAAATSEAALAGQRLQRDLQRKGQESNNQPNSGLLADLPSKRMTKGLEAPGFVAATPQIARSAIREAMASPPERTTLWGSAANPKTPHAEDRAGASRLSTIMLQFLRQQHKTACLSAQQPVSTLPPLSLRHTNVLPQAKHMLHASRNVARRTLEGQIAPGGGLWGKKQTRHFVYSRFRHRKSIRDVTEDGTAGLKACSFLAAGEKLLVGTEAGELRLFQDLSSDVVEEYEAHSNPISKLQVYESDGGGSWVLSSSKTEVKLWDATKLDREPLCCFAGCRRGVFSPDARFVAAAVAQNNLAQIFDAASQALVLTLDDPEGNARVPRDICFNRSGELLLFGASLWDPRAPRRVHRFDQFSETCGGSVFHPAGLEAILNSEVWDLRTFRLLRSVPHLDGATLAFNKSGSVAYASLRRASEDSGWALHSHRTRHRLYTAFGTVDTADYSEIARVEVDGRCILDLAADPVDCSLALITADPDGVSSSTRIYDVGKQRSEGDDTDYEANEGSDGEGSDDDESDNSDEEPDLEEAALLRMSDAEEEPGDEEAPGEQGSEAAGEMEEDAEEEAEAEGEGGVDSVEGEPQEASTEDGAAFEDDPGLTTDGSDDESFDSRSETMPSEGSDGSGALDSPVTGSSEPSSAASEDAMESD